MRFKTDENIHPDVGAVLRERGHDAVSVWDQQMRGVDDPQLAERCRAEGRVLITFDMGFADIRAYPPEATPGLIVLRLGSQDRVHVTSVARRMVHALASADLNGRLWIVTERDIRIRGGEAPTTGDD